MRGVKKLKTKPNRRIFKTNAENPGRIVKLHAPVVKESIFQNNLSTNCDFKFREIHNKSPELERRTVAFPVYNNNQCFKYTSEQLKAEIGDLNGRPGVDDDNDTTESLIKKQVGHIFKTMLKGVQRENRYFDPSQYLTSHLSELSSQSGGSSMKFDDSKIFKLGSSIAEETIANSSISDLSIGEDMLNNMFPLESISK